MIKNLQELISGKPFEEERRKALSIIESALLAADAGEAVKRSLRLDGNALIVGKERIEMPAGKIYVVGAGKASAAMAKALDEILGERIYKGTVISTSACSAGKIEVVEGTHPLPSETNVSATAKILKLIESANEQDLVIALISGGGSALLCKPAKGLSLKDLEDTNKLLLLSNAEIYEINCVRKHLSDVKGGKLAEKAFPASLIALIVSDVVGDDISVIASGPTASDATTYRDAIKVLKKHNIFTKVPTPVRKCLEEGVSGKRKETLKPGDKELERVKNLIILRKDDALKAMEKSACELGMKPVLLKEDVCGNARRAGINLIRKASCERKKAGKYIALIAAGETTVEVKGIGTGGRNQEMVLASLEELSKYENTVFIALDSDGKDGSSIAAGAIADSSSLERAKRLRLDPKEFLKNNDSFHFFEKLSDAIITGPTGSNVADLYVVVMP
jgi:glycerate-2-kinase